MASIASSIRGLPNRFVYGATKAAVIGLTKSIAADYVKQGIRCNAIVPGHGRYAVARRTASTRFADPVQARKDFIARQPMGRLGTADDIIAHPRLPRLRRVLFATGVASIDGGMTIPFKRFAPLPETQ